MPDNGPRGGWWWMFRKPSKTETVNFDTQTQVIIPLLQALSIAICSTLIFLLWTVLWLTFPRGWAVGISWVTVGFTCMVVAFWVAKRRGKQRRAVLFFPVGVGLINYVAMAQSDLWWGEFWPYAIGLAIGLGLAAGAIAPVYLFGRETISRYETTEFEDALAQWLRDDPSRLLQAEQGLTPTEKPKSPLGRVLDQLPPVEGEI